jgi:hypothetical protein
MRIISAIALIVTVAACGPEPNTPSDESLAGVWISSAHLYSLSNFRMTLIQEPKGIVSGTWTAKGDGGNGGCLPATPCNATGNVIGLNTVAQVEIALIGAGRFEGALLEQNRLRGIFAVGASYDTITFMRTSQ